MKMTLAPEVRDPNVSLTDFNYHGLALRGIVVNVYMMEFGTTNIVTCPRQLVTEKTMAIGLGCSYQRLHKAIVRSKFFTGAKIDQIEGLTDAIGYCYTGADQRLIFEGMVYNPVWWYDAVIKDLATRRPYIANARAFYKVC